MFTSRVRCKEPLSSVILIKFHIILNKYVKETFDVIHELYKDETLSRTCVFEWQRKLKVSDVQHGNAIPNALQSRLALPQFLFVPWD